MLCNNNKAIAKPSFPPAVYNVAHAPSFHFSQPQSPTALSETSPPRMYMVQEGYLKAILDSSLSRIKPSASPS